jgi:hypothetical protein
MTPTMLLQRTNEPPLPGAGPPYRWANAEEANNKTDNATDIFFTDSFSFRFEDSLITAAGRVGQPLGSRDYKSEKDQE